MAVYFRHTCGTCGGAVVTDEKRKAYVHADRGTRHDHAVGHVVATRLGDDRGEAGAA